MCLRQTERSAGQARHSAQRQGCLPIFPFPQLGSRGDVGGRRRLCCPRQNGQLLMACEGMHPGAWWRTTLGLPAGAVCLVNLSDIAAMGGRPLALVNSVWSTGGADSLQRTAGGDALRLRSLRGADGGRALQSAELLIRLLCRCAVLGVAEGPVLSARAARPGDELWMLVNKAGGLYRHYPFWDAATHAPPERLRAQLALLPMLAAERLVHAAKDISMGGITGTAVMFAEACGHQLVLDLDAVERPEGIHDEAWLTCFPSFGYLLAVDPSRTAALAQLACTRFDADLLPYRSLCPGRLQCGCCTIQVKRITSGMALMR